MNVSTINQKKKDNIPDIICIVITLGKQIKRYLFILILTSHEDNQNSCP